MVKKAFLLALVLMAIIATVPARRAVADGELDGNRHPYVHSVVAQTAMGDPHWRRPVSGQGTWETTLKGRDLDGNPANFEAYYDTVLGITWLAAANVVGAVDWVDANIFVTDLLDVHGVTGWRLPKVRPIDNIGFNLELSTNGTTDRGTASTTTNGSDGGWRDSSRTPVSELGHMYYVTLGNRGVCDAGLPWCTVQIGWGLINTGPFFNLERDIFWSSTGSSAFPSCSHSAGFRHCTQKPGFAWGFFFGLGTQGVVDNTIGFNFVWAVHDGDVGTISLKPTVSTGKT